MRAYQDEDWYAVYTAAVLELESLKMTGRIEDARSAITSRLEVFKTAPGLHTDEYQRIDDALRTLRLLERESLAQEEERRIAAESLSKIRPIETRLRNFGDQNSK